METVFFKAEVTWFSTGITETHLLCGDKSYVKGVCEHEILNNRDIESIELYQKVYPEDEWRFVCSY